MSDLVIVKVKDGINVKADMMGYWRKEIMKQKETGVIVFHMAYTILSPITTTDVAMMMALLKIARIKNGGGTGDSFVDLAGYAACGGELNALASGKEKIADE